ncbi:putative E3 ubiquitin-protein ligase ARI1 isoform X1 [Senna tora]|uniref:RBR-type E3 ubiquitin transferase n=1 Tax=Senna tora TaxID=362788 RepID=A0A834X9Q9_9FABA|nr:putative E3 ubiquitin-protein ligase ARI1 isoform X1 [Senna tora]
MEEDYYMSSDDECRYSDEECVDGYATQAEPDFELVTKKGTTTKVITKESLLAAQKEDLHRVMELLSVKERHARTLLIYHRWDVDTLFTVYVEKGKTLLFAEAGVSVENHCESGSAVPSSIMCEICIEDVPSDKATRMDCGHIFCNNCWTEHFIVKINEGLSKRIRCMAHKCNAICDEDVIRTLVRQKQPYIAEKFERFLLESYIEDNKRAKWCPSTPHCGNAIRVEDGQLCEVECSCGFQFCFSCLSEAHSPCSCLMWELWAKKCQDESETVNWITVNTKPCPKCHKPVEKNGGCNLVSCICGQSFCWLCGGPTGREHTWTSITGHSCGRFKDQEDKTERAKRDLYRYVHYHNRYKAHMDSFQLESKLKVSIAEKVAISEKRHTVLVDYGWVNAGLFRLFLSRRVLSYSYPFAFYMFGEELFKDEMTEEERVIKQNLFEDQQQQLEANVEKLSKILEEPFDEFSVNKLMEIRIRVVNLCNSIDKLCQGMYDCVENELLGSLAMSVHYIAPYKSSGIERAAKLSFCQSNEANNTGGTADLDRPSGSGSSDERGSSSHKRARKEDLRGDHIDLNLPADP